VSETETIAQAYRHCELLTREQAANFYYAIRMLPLARRRAICAVYAFARRVDDIADGTLEREEKLRLLDVQAQLLAELSSTASGSSGASVSSTASGSASGSASSPVPEEERPASDTDPVMVALADTYARFSLPPTALEDLIEGMRMDVEEVTYEHFEDLVLYCRRVAGSIGRVSLAIFGARGPGLTARSATRDAGRSSIGKAGQLADDLGVAMQLTNILRDLREDAEIGRVYLPAEDLRRFGVIADGDERGAPAILAALARSANGSEMQAGRGGRAAETDGADWLHALVRFEADRARQWFRQGMTLTPLIDRRSAACVRAMAGIYRRLLDRIEADPERALRERISLQAREKAWVAVRGVLSGSG
jgi:15-cis-phytoene synthase